MLHAFQHTIDETFCSLSKITCIAMYMNGESVEYTVIGFERTKKQLHLSQSAFKTNSEQELFEKIDTQVPLALYIDGKGIISRFVEGTNISEIDITEHFKDFSEHDFIRHYTIVENGAIVSFARKQLIQQIHNNFIQQGHTIIHLKLGVEAYIYAHHYISIDNLPSIPHWNISVTHNSIYNFDRKSSTTPVRSIKCGNETIQSDVLFAYLLAFECFQSSFLKTSTHNYAHHSKKDFFFRTIAKKSGITAIIFLFVLLLGNTLLYNHYFSQHQELVEQVNESSYILQTYQHKQYEYDQIRTLLSHINIQSHTQYSYHFDRIGATLPKDLILERIDYNPLLHDIRNEKEISFKTQTAIIRGFAYDITSVHNWIQKLQDEKWSNSVHLIDFSKNESEKNALFIIEIFVK